MNRISFHSIDALEDQLCQAISGDLRLAIEKRGTARLLVSGGSTPQGLFNKLSKVSLPWELVEIGLVDDRYVPASHPKSNARLVGEHLVINSASKAHFVPLVYTTSSKEENMAEALSAYKPFAEEVDVSLLGMGLDGHTASLFPGDPVSVLALQEGRDEPLVYTTADVAPFERISCSRSLLHNSSSIYLMITGQDKLDVLNTASEKKLPIAAFFETAKTELNIYHTNQAS